ncbi:MAG: hypothetical protein IJU76_14720 [Desulfovibrionaceae bacterium]|nr:hypothetical protein [Desulfovibrionaceae bacterium]
MLPAHILYSVQEMLALIFSCCGLTAHAFTRLYTDDVDGVLLSDDGSLVSLMRLDGSLRMLGDEEFTGFIASLTTVLAITLGKACHAVQIVFSYDPDGAKALLDGHFAPIEAQAKAMHLTLGRVLSDWKEKIRTQCADESVFIAFWTTSDALTRGLRKEIRKKEGRVAGSIDRQCRSLEAGGLRDMHISHIQKLLGFFASCGMKAVWLSSRAAVRSIRHMLAPASTSGSWSPLLARDHVWPTAQEYGARDVSSFLPPTLARQIWPGTARIVDSRFVALGDRLYAPCLLALAPQTLLPFDTLFRSLKGSIPWRASFLLTGDGLGRIGLSNLMAQILSFASSSNVMLANACRSLKDASVQGHCIVGFQAAFCTWVSRSATPRAVEELVRRSAKLQSQIQSWGSCETEDTVGDPLLGLCATIPALMPNSPAPRALAPLDEALSLLPLRRASSPWNTCDLPLRTPDGKFMPIGLFHSRQASWNEVVFAGMGAGKSFFLNTINFFFLLRPGQSRLPWLTVIDIGPSCSGLITLLKWALPPKERHCAVFARIRNAASRAINPFDTPLGCPYPLRNHLEFLNNLLSLLCTPLDRTAPADGISALLREACDHLYRRLAPDGAAPKHFDPYTDSAMTETLREAQFVYDDETTWWDVVFFFFAQGDYDAAIRAQRHAMPLLSDLAQIVTEHNVSENYAAITAGNGSETVPQACSRYLISAITEYPVLANTTQFSLGSARIIGLDLHEVTPRGGIGAVRQSGIMYMMARFVGAAHFFLTVDDLEEIPEAFRTYHKPRIEALAADPKRLCYDEFHRASCQDMENPLSRQIISDLATATRESRKRNLSIGLYSQRLTDFPPELVAMATSVYALGASNAGEAEAIAERFGYNTAAYEALRTITRPSAAGAECIALYRTGDGECIQYLTNSAGSYAAWAFSTTAEDMRLRDRLYQALGCERALTLLHTRYPEGSIKEELERRRAELGEKGRQWEDIEEAVFTELMAYAQARDSSLDLELRA